MIRLKKIVFIFILVFLLTGCEPTLRIAADGFSSTEIEYGAKKPEWHDFFIISYNADAIFPEKEVIVKWTPEFDALTPGDYEMYCEYTDESGVSVSETIVITVLPKE